jgi:hypothetical protein
LHHLRPAGKKKTARATHTRGKPAIFSIFSITGASTPKSEGSPCPAIPAPGISI